MSNELSPAICARCGNERVVVKHRPSTTSDITPSNTAAEAIATTTTG